MDWISRTEKQGPYKADKCKTCPQYCPECVEIAKWEKEHKCRTSHSKRDSLCWCCKYSVPKPEHNYICPWADRGKPVEGWTANLHKTAGGELHAAVIDCPYFERGTEAEEYYGYLETTE